MSEEQKDSASKPEAKKNKKPMIIGVIVAAVAVLGIGLWTWHSTPGFCSAVCHVPMNSFVVTYDQEAGTTGVDKWGNEVSNTDSMLVVSHKASGQNCLSCHVPSVSQQMGELGEVATGDYYYPLEETNLEVLQINSGHEAGTGEDFCLKSGCHVTDSGSPLTKADLTDTTSDMIRNPHSWHHSQYTCSDCHKSHRASVLICTQCHADA